MAEHETQPQEGAPDAGDAAAAARQEVAGQLEAAGLAPDPPPAHVPPGDRGDHRSPNEPDAGNEPAVSETAEEPAESDELPTPAEVALALTRPDDFRAYAEQIAEEESAAEEVEALQSGEAVEQIVQAQDVYDNAIGDLIRENPGLENPEAIAAMEGPFEAVRELYGDEIAMSPPIIRQLYESVGGEEKYGSDPVVAQYERAFSGTPPNRFGF